ncbi:lethal(3)malignant brain tumor-like protein 4 isoform X2 [Triplophysa dalaica]|uniref:lethal(3)malignant brain tumor-like protein 4 isoform X2 n=1 Tax=Triplophysa dalaica TaxID=1582913 RepID=UPI0024DFB686|nr:lethal(3)malignant brain tumor-like protein 4 isoform X2 [Triplophysa dalaica]
MMQTDDRRRKKHSLNSRSVSEEYCLRDRPKEDTTKMKNKVSTSQVSSRKKPWSWDQYLEDERAVAAPLQLFNEFQTFPSSRNGFKVGMRLEGIDPLHPSMFCVLSVAEVIGFRLRLHVDGYSECYDLWVNSDSPGIKPAGWCESTGHKLHPPKGYKPNEFRWENYLESLNAQAAPKNLFKTQNSISGSSSAFQVGMKLEAVDRKNPCLVCVATVADIVDNQFLVHFDNWDDTYDYWCDASSPYIHPVGWCQDQGRPLTAPQGHPNPENFIWEEYMTETSTCAAPSQAFSLRAAHGFQVHMKLEAVDRRNPMMIRVATVTDTEDFRVKLHFDGWHERFDFWVDSDLPDLHPVGWCARTGHPLEPPPNAGVCEQKSSVAQGVCPTPGCRGIGHIKGAKYTGHHSAFGCPYSDMNMKKEVVLPDRLGGEKQITFIPVQFVQKTKRLCPDEEEEEDDDEKIDNTHVENRGMLAGYEGTPRLRGRPPIVKREQKEETSTEGLNILSALGKRSHVPSRFAQSAKYLRIKDEEEDMEVDSVISGGNMDSLQQALHQSVFLSALSAHPSRDLPLCWEQHCKLLPGVAGVQASRVAHWTAEEVSDFIHSLPGCEEQAKQFREEQIDGKAFLLLTQRDIVKIMSVKLGPALKIYNSILMFKHGEDNQSASSDTNT